MFGRLTARVEDVDDASARAIGLDAVRNSRDQPVGLGVLHKVVLAARNLRTNTINKYWITSDTSCTLINTCMSFICFKLVRSTLGNGHIKVPKEKVVMPQNVCTRKYIFSKKNNY